MPRNVSNSVKMTQHPNTVWASGEGWLFVSQQLLSLWALYSEMMIGLFTFRGKWVMRSCGVCWDLARLWSSKVSQLEAHNKWKTILAHRSIWLTFCNTRCDKPKVIPANLRSQEMPINPLNFISSIRRSHPSSVAFWARAVRCRSPASSPRLLLAYCSSLPVHVDRTERSC